MDATPKEVESGDSGRCGTAWYADVPMDFADATLVALAEAEGWDRVFTLDDDFRVYRIGGRKSVKIVP